MNLAQTLSSILQRDDDQEEVTIQKLRALKVNVNRNSSENSALLECTRHACYNVRNHKIRSLVVDLYGTLILEQDRDEAISPVNLECLIHLLKDPHEDVWLIVMTHLSSLMKLKPTSASLDVLWIAILASFYGHAQNIPVQDLFANFESLPSLKIRVLEAICAGKDSLRSFSTYYTEAWKCARTVLEGWQKSFYHNWMTDKVFLKNFTKEIMRCSMNTSSEERHIVEGISRRLFESGRNQTTLWEAMSDLFLEDLSADQINILMQISTPSSDAEDHISKARQNYLGCLLLSLEKEIGIVGESLEDEIILSWNFEKLDALLENCIFMQNSLEDYFLNVEERAAISILKTLSRLTIPWQELEKRPRLQFLSKQLLENFILARFRSKETFSKEQMNFCLQNKGTQLMEVDRVSDAELFNLRVWVFWLMAWIPDSDLSDLTNSLVPPILKCLDEYRSPHRQLGLWMLSHLIDHIEPSLLRRNNYARMFYEVVLHILSSKSRFLAKSSNRCLLRLLEILEIVGSKEYYLLWESALEELLRMVELVTDSTLRVIRIQTATTIIERLGWLSIKQLDRIHSLVLDCSQSNDANVQHASLILCKAMLETCWPRLKGKPISSELITHVSFFIQNSELNKELEIVKKMLRDLIC